MANTKKPVRNLSEQLDQRENPAVTRGLEAEYGHMSPEYLTSAGNYHIYDIDNPELPEALNFLIRNELSGRTIVCFVKPTGGLIDRDCMDDASCDWHNCHDLPMHVKDAIHATIPQGEDYDTVNRDADEDEDRSRDDHEDDDHNIPDEHSIHESAVTNKGTKKMARTKKLAEAVEDAEVGNVNPMGSTTPAGQTLQPMAGSGGTESKAQMLDTFVQLLSQLGVQDLSNIFNAVQAQYGPGLVQGIDDKAAEGNMQSIMAKPSAASVWKEDVAEIFAGEALDEDLRTKAAVIFESAVNTRLVVESERLREEYETQFQTLGEEYAAKVIELEEAFDTSLKEETAKIAEDLTGKLDRYLDNVVMEWMQENKLAIDNGIRTEIAENFINGLQNLFAEHYITVPENRVDLVAEMRAELDAVKSKLNEAVDENTKLHQLVEQATKEQIVNELTEGLTVSQAERLRNLSESVEFTDADTFSGKLKILKDKYFSEARKAPRSTGLITESIDGSETETENRPAVRSDVKRYVEAIRRSVK